MNVVGTLIIDAFRLGGDSLLMGLGAGFVVLRLRDRVAWAIAFGACDGAASVLGAECLHRSIDIPGAAYFALIGLMVALVSCGKRWVLWCVPLIFSVDNFFSMTPADEAPVLAMSSALFAFVGLCGASLLSTAGDRIVRISARRRPAPLRRDENA